jgi:hypothetical protein
MSQGPLGRGRGLEFWFFKRSLPIISGVWDGGTDVWAPDHRFKKTTTKNTIFAPYLHTCAQTFPSIGFDVCVARQHVQMYIPKILGKFTKIYISKRQSKDVVRHGPQPNLYNTSKEYVFEMDSFVRGV